MDGARAGGRNRKRHREGWRDLAPLALLLVLAAGVRLWHLTHTEVAARDSIGFIRQAWQLRHRPWADVLRQAEQHPGYPFAVLAVSGPVRQFVTGPDALTMQLSAQLASSLAGALLVIPMFYLGKALFNRAAGFWAALLFQCQPAGGRVLSDGLSEATFLLFAATALLFAVRGLRTGSPLRLALCGLFGGLAYLTRPEGALIVAATGLVLVGAQAVGRWRRPWRQTTAGAAGLGLAALVVGGPFVAVTGQLTVKPTGKIVIEARAAPPPPEPGTLAAGQPLLAVWHPEKDVEGSASRRLGWGLKVTVLEVIEAGSHITWLPALAGLWWYRGRLRHDPGPWAVLLLCLVLGLVLWRVAVKVGYLSDRHALLLVLCSTFWAAAGMRALPYWLVAAARRRPGWVRLSQAVESARFRRWAPGLLLLALAAAGLPKTLQPLHTNRSGFRDAGLWLAEHTHPTDLITDPYCWTHYYAGRVFLEGTRPPVPPGHRPTEYLVFESSGNEHPNLRVHAQVKARKDEGEVVYRWDVRRRKDRCEVQVFAVAPSSGNAE